VFKQAYHNAATILQLPIQPIETKTALYGSQAGQVLMDPLTLIMRLWLDYERRYHMLFPLNRIQLVQEAVRLLVDRVCGQRSQKTLHWRYISPPIPHSPQAYRSPKLFRRSTLIQNPEFGFCTRPNSLRRKAAAWFPGEGDHMIGAIEPDILGEAFVIDQLSRDRRCKRYNSPDCNTRAKLVVQFLIRAAQDFGLAEFGSREEPIRWLDILVIAEKNTVL